MKLTQACHSLRGEIATTGATEVIPETEAAGAEGPDPPTIAAVGPAEKTAISMPTPPAEATAIGSARIDILDETVAEATGASESGTVTGVTEVAGAGATTTIGATVAQSGTCSMTVEVEAGVSATL